MLLTTAFLAAITALASAAHIPEKRQLSPFYPVTFNTSFTAFAKATPATTYGLAGFGELGGFPVLYTVTQVTNSGLTAPAYGALVHVSEAFTGPCAIVSNTFKCGASVNNSNNSVGLFVIDKTFDLALGRTIQYLLPPKQYTSPAPLFSIASVAATGKKVLDIRSGSGAVAFVEFKST